MTFGLTPTGFNPKTTDDIVAEIGAALRANIDPTLDTSAESVIGQFIAAFAVQTRSTWELGGAAYSARDPGAAANAQLEAVCALTGTKRRAKTKGRVTLRLQLTNGTTVTVGAVAQVSGQPENRWVTLATVTNSSGVTDWFEVEAEAQTAGVYRANAHAITVIATPVSGWLAVDNNLDAAAGTDDEKDPALRARRDAELSRPGSTTLPAVRAELLELVDDDGEALLVAAVVQANTSSVTDSEGRPPHSVEAIVQFAPGLAGAPLAAARQAVADQLFASVAAGIGTFGQQSATVLDPQGDPQTVRWNEPTEVPVWVEISLSVDPETYVGDAAVQQAVLDFGDTLALGDDVVRNRLLCAVLDLAGVRDVLALTLGTSASLLQPSNIAIGPRDVAAFDSSRITVAS